MVCDAYFRANFVCNTIAPYISTSALRKSHIIIIEAPGSGNYRACVIGAIMLCTNLV